METCRKVFRREVLTNIKFESNRFGFEPESTAKIAKGNWQIYEVSISYAGRSLCGRREDHLAGRRTLVHSALQPVRLITGGMTSAHARRQPYKVNFPDLCWSLPNHCHRSGLMFFTDYSRSRRNVIERVRDENDFIVLALERYPLNAS
jgi:hypothetical protein